MRHIQAALVGPLHERLAYGATSDGPAAAAAAAGAGVCAAGGGGAAATAAGAGNAPSALSMQLARSGSQACGGANLAWYLQVRSKVTEPLATFS